MSVTTKQVNENALVWYDTRYTQRWLDALGEDVVKYLGNLEQDADSTNDIGNMTVTVVETGGGGNSTIVKSTTAGQLFTITTDNAEYDGVNIMLEGEAFKLESDKPIYFGCKFALGDVDKEDIFVGFSESDTAIFNAASHALAVAGDLAGFVSADSDTSGDMKVLKDGSETGTAACATTLTDGGTFVFEMYWDGSTLYGYENDTLISSFSSDLPDGDLTPTIHVRTANAAAETATIYWWRIIQCR